MPVARDGNKVNFYGLFGASDLHRPLACIHQAVNAGYSDIALDFSQCTAAFPGPMLALCSHVLRLRNSRVDFEVVLPRDDRLARLFRNANWAHLLEPRSHAESTFRGHSQVPATQFRTPDDQNRAVNRIVNAVLGAIPELERSDFAALEWSINEITDNVIVHAESPVGGLVQVSTFVKNQKRVEYIVADAGLGIPATLRGGRSDIRSDTEALDFAIREGVTRDPSLGQGNGLFGSYRICNLSHGRFQIDSGHAKLFYSEDAGLAISNEPVPIEGTVVIAQIDFSNPQLLEDALQFGGRRHAPVDYVETHYEGMNSEDLHFYLKDEARTFGSRASGTPARNKLVNLLRMCPNQRVTIDCDDVPLISSSFADEVFGKLFLQLGPLTFMQRVVITNVDATVKSLIDRAIMQRSATG